MTFPDWTSCFWEGGSDREQRLVCEKLRKIRGDFQEYVENNGVVIAICGGYQLLGKYYKTEQDTIEGLSLVDMYTEQGERRLISNIVLESDMFDMPVVGFENHGGRTFIGENKPLGNVLCGFGNDGKSRLRGRGLQKRDRDLSSWPAASQNPQLADWLIQKRWSANTVSR